MRRLLLLGSSIVVVACLLGRPSVARPPDASPAKTDATGRPQEIAIRYSQQPESGRANLVIGRLRTPRVHTVPSGVELSFATSRPIWISEDRNLREVLAVESHAEAGHFIVLIRLACDCTVESSRAGKTFSILLRDPAKTAGPAAHAADNGNAAHAADNSSAAQAADNGKAAHAPDNSKPAQAAKHGKAAPAADQSKAEIAKLRDSLTARLAALNAPPDTSKGSQPPRSTSLNPTVAAEVGPASIPRPPCTLDLDMSRWKGPDSFPATLTALRHATAEAHEGAPEMATLAEFYLAYGLAGEAQDTAHTALTGDVSVTDPDRSRLLRDADLAALLRGTPIGAASPLLAERPGCERTDIPLWRALAAAASHDAIGVARDIHTARSALGNMPEPLLQAFVYRLADAVDDVAALRDVAAAVRNSSEGLPEDESARFLLQARIARAGGDTGDEFGFLERAARHELTVPGIVAAERVAELASTKDDDAGSHSEAVLGDMARVYRGGRLGQDAAAALADRHLRHQDYISALTVADESASPDGVRGTDSRGAALVAKILRLLLVEPTGANLPDPDNRIALYLKYDGYATPGQVGDSIRLGAAKLMLSQDMASAARDVLQQLSDEVASTPQAAVVRAQAEALGGDPAVALLLLRNLPVGADTQRAGADALERLGRPGDAAHRLDGLTTIADRLRRAALLCQAKAWSAAAAAYSELLRDPALTADARGEVADRYAFALALAGQSPDRTLPDVQGGVAARTLAALHPPGNPATMAAGSPLFLTAIEGSLQRAKQVETLLPASGSK
jgi:hypothetical protein